MMKFLHYKKIIKIYMNMQLTKRSTTMTKNIAEYGHFKKINDPEIIEKIRELNIECERIPPKKILQGL